MMQIRRPLSGEEQQLLKLEEGQFIDFKSQLIKPAKLQTHFVAFANTDGGDIYVGIEDQKVLGERINGFTKPEDANSVVSTLLQLTQPSVEDLEVEFIDFSNRGYVLHFFIPKSPKVHFTSDNECYIRVNASTNKITGERIVQLGYSKGTYSYERKILTDIVLDDVLDKEYLQNYLTRIGSSQSVHQFLRKQKLSKLENDVDYPTVGCVLLYDDEPQATLSTRCAIKVYRLRTTDSDYKREYLEEDPKTFEGMIEYQINEVIDYVIEALSGATYMVAGALIKLAYPAEALKEILVNAVIHRDYSLNDDIHVRIYDNRIEIQSPGRLPGYVTPANILDERFSRNPGIVRLLHKLPNPPNKDIGEGLDTAFNEMRKAGLVPPIVSEIENAVMVTIKHQRIASLEEVIMEYLEDNEFVTNKVIRELSGEGSENKVKKAFQKLREQKVVEPENPDARLFDFRYRKGSNFSEPIQKK